jgi:hypothetical protein
MQAQRGEVVGGDARHERAVGHHALVEAAANPMATGGASGADEDDAPGVAGTAPRPARRFGREFNPNPGARGYRGMRARLRPNDPRS